MVKYYHKRDYNNLLFYCPRVFAKDGFNVSLQINYGDYCSSDKGYRQFSLTFIDVEFGYPNISEPLMIPYSESYCDNTNIDVTESVGKIPISVMEEVFIKHGGIDWERTIGIDNIMNYMKA
jgi:hypothetical protein